MKTMIIVAGSANMGKTTTLRNVANLLGIENPPRLRGEVCNCATITLEGKEIRVGVSSQGDTKECVANGLSKLQQKATAKGIAPLDVIVVATRAKGAPLGAALTFAAEHGYQMIRVTPYWMIAPDSFAPIRHNAEIAPNLTIDEMLARNIIEIIKTI